MANKMRTQVPNAAVLFIVAVPFQPPAMVRIKVQACACVTSDSLTKEGYWPGIQFREVPGHDHRSNRSLGERVFAMESEASAWVVGGMANCGYGDNCPAAIFCVHGGFEDNGISFDAVTANIWLRRVSAGASAGRIVRRGWCAFMSPDHTFNATAQQWPRPAIWWLCSASVGWASRGSICTEKVSGLWIAWQG